MNKGIMDAMSSCNLFRKGKYVEMIFFVKS